MDKPIFTRRISSGTRVYYLDARQDRKKQYYLTISEVATDNHPGEKKRHRIFIHAESLDEFSKLFNEVAEVIKTQNVSKS